jgi:hypothetical protein
LKGDEMTTVPSEPTTERVCKCSHQAASHDRREDWCSAAVEEGNLWASDRYIGWERGVAGPAAFVPIDLFECRCERFTRKP